MKQCPGLVLWIVLFEVSKKSGIGEMLEAGCVIAHDIGRSWDVLTVVTISVVALVSIAEAAEESCCAGSGDSAFGGPRDGWGVVTHVFKGGVPDVMSRSHEVQLSKLGCLFEVTVGDGASGVFPRDEAVLDGWRERAAPEVAVSLGVIVNAAHTLACCVGGTQECWFLRDYLS